MHHAIEYQHFSTSTLQVGPASAPHGPIAARHPGVALLKLGAHELLLTPGSHFWLCADALAAFTPLAGCQHDLLACSVQVPQPAQAGWLQASPLMDALLDSLAAWSRPRDWQGPYGQRLLQVVGMSCTAAPSRHWGSGTARCLASPGQSAAG